MKIYTIDYDFNRPMMRSITVPTNTEYKIGIAATRNGLSLGLTEDQVTIKLGNGATLRPTGEYNGYITFNYQQGNIPSDQIATVKIQFARKFYNFELKIVGKYSTKGDIQTGATPTALFEGEYEDGTSFSMNVCIA